MSATDLFDQLIDQYKLEKHIERRNFTDVYLAYDVDHNQSVELEILLPEFASDGRFAQQFTQRAQALGQLRHPNIAHVLQVGVTPDARPYIATERIDGYPLTDRLAQLAQQPKATHSIYALKLVRQITTALLLTERLDLYHSQLTPDHILLKKVKLKADDAVVVINLGIPTQEKLSPNGRFSSPDQPYLSPEQQEGRPIDSRSHVYSLGVILYIMLAGELPQGPDPLWARLLATARSNKTALEKARPDLALETVTLVARCLRKEPRRRFQSLAELATALDAAIAAEELRIHTSAAAQQARRPWAIYLLPLALLLCLGVGFFALRGIPGFALGGAEATATTGAAVGPAPSATATPTAVPRPTTRAATAVAATNPPAAATPLPSATATPTHTPTPPPTATPTATPSSTATPSPTPTPQFRITASSASLRTGPGTMYAVAAYVYTGDLLQIIARNDGDNVWYNVRLPNGTLGWISATVGELSDPAMAAGIPTAAAIPPVPTATSTPIPTSTPSPTATPTPDGSGDGGGNDNPTPEPPRPTPTPPL